MKCFMNRFMQDVSDNAFLTKSARILRVGLACLALSVPALAQSPAPPEMLPRPLMERKIESAERGGPRALADMQGRATLLIVIGQHSGDAGDEQQTQLGLNEAAVGVTRVTVADLRGVPFFVKGGVRNDVRKLNQKYNDAIENGYKTRGKPLGANSRFVTLLDWSGDVARQMNIGGKTDRTYHAFVLAPSGQVLLHLRQGENGLSEEALRAQVVAALQKAAK